MTASIVWFCRIKKTHPTNYTKQSIELIGYSEEKHYPNRILVNKECPKKRKLVFHTFLYSKPKNIFEFCVVHSLCSSTLQSFDYVQFITEIGCSTVETRC